MSMIAVKEPWGGLNSHESGLPVTEVFKFPFNCQWSCHLSHDAGSCHHAPELGPARAGRPVPRPADPARNLKTLIQG